MSCSEHIGHEDCNWVWIESVWEGAKADPDAWKRSKKKTYLRKIEAKKKTK